jgi:hypothetical protein
MADPVTTSGSRVYISTTAITSSTNSVALFAALTWTEIGNIETIGDFGDESPLVTFSAIGAGRVFKTKGARDAGEMTLTVAHDPADAGQSACIAAEQTKFNYGFRVILADATGPSMSNSVIYFRGIVRSQRFNPGGNDAVTRRNYAIALNSQLYSSLSISV